MIEIQNLRKSYGRVEAVRDISFYVKQGDLFAFLGPNGAGKSTTIDILCTLLGYDGGEVLIDGRRLGKDDDHIRSVIGVVFQDSVLDGLLTVEENLKLRAGLYGDRRSAARRSIDEIAEATEITEILGRRYGRLSGGQRRRVDIARALVNTPKLLFLDEPTTGLDPQSRNNIWDIIGNLKQQMGVTVFMTTHYMEEAAKSDYVTLIDDGRIAVQGTPAELKSTYAHDRLRLRFRGEDNKRRLIETLGAHGFKEDTATNASGEGRYTVEGELIVCRIPSTLAAIPLIREMEGLIEGFEVINGTMDDAFIEITGKELRE